MVISVHRIFSELCAVVIEYSGHLRRTAPKKFVWFVSSIGISRQDALAMLC